MDGQVREVTQPANYKPLPGQMELFEMSQAISYPRSLSSNYELSHQVTAGVGSTHNPETYPEARNKQAIAVCCGVGVDSVAMLVEMHKRGMRPDLITFADTGSEKPETYEYLTPLRQWLSDVDFPELVIVKNLCPRAGHQSLHDNCFRNETLPSIAFGMKSCSLRWKKEPQDRW